MCFHTISGTESTVTRGCSEVSDVMKHPLDGARRRRVRVNYSEHQKAVTQQSVRHQKRHIMMRTNQAWSGSYVSCLPAESLRWQRVMTRRALCGFSCHNRAFSTFDATEHELRARSDETKRFSSREPLKRRMSQRSQRALQPALLGFVLLEFKQH